MIRKIGDVCFDTVPISVSKVRNILSPYYRVLPEYAIDRALSNLNSSNQKKENIQVFHFII